MKIFQTSTIKKWVKKKSCSSFKLKTLFKIIIVTACKQTVHKNERLFSKFLIDSLLLPIKCSFALENHRHPKLRL